MRRAGRLGTVRNPGDFLSVLRDSTLSRRRCLTRPFVSHETTEELQLEVHLVMKLEPRKHGGKKWFLRFSVAQFRRDYLCVKVTDRCSFHTLHEHSITEGDTIAKR